MASLTIRNLDEKIKAMLRLEAARHGHSMEEEVRRILQRSVMGEELAGSASLAERINRRFTGLQADTIVLPSRQLPRTPPSLDAEA
ncbi:MAG: plasmid stabilization protein [Gallionellaceae bacterium]|nr:plasmid stabilization protein [Gallionellaceae bacterium]MDD5363786.1 plasmid stabilization protein [Gallionellaceae bacterium]